MSYDEAAMGHSLELATPTPTGPAQLDNGPGLDDGAITPDAYKQQEHQEQQQEEYLTASLKHTLITNMTSFFQTEVAPRSAAIAEDVHSLQYEAQLLLNKAQDEKDSVLVELDRLHKLVAAFQAQIREALGPMSD